MGHVQQLDFKWPDDSWILFPTRFDAVPSSKPAMFDLSTNEVTDFGRAHHHSMSEKTDNPNKGFLPDPGMPSIHH